MAKMTIQEKIEMLETLKDIEETINGFEKQMVQHIEWEVITNEEDGLEEEQATNCKGELLYVQDGERYPFRGTKEEMSEKGIEEYSPYYRVKYRSVQRPYEELSDYEKESVIKTLAVKLFLEDIDIEGKFPAYLEKARKVASTKVQELTRVEE